MAMHKYGVRMKNEEHFRKLIECLGNAAVKVDLLEAKYTSPVSLKRNSHGCTKGASSILYNSARIETLLRNFADRVRSGLYPDLPGLDIIDINLLTEEEEWIVPFTIVVCVFCWVYMMTQEPLGDQLILATGGYDHTIKLWQAHTGNCIRTMPHEDSQVNCLDRTPDKLMLAAGGYQCIRLYDMTSNSGSPIISFEGVSKNVTRLGFQEDGKWMFTGGEDCKVRIWDMSSSNPQCKRMFDCMTPINAVCLHPNQVEMAIGSQGGGVYLWDVKSDVHEQLIPEVDASVQDIAISPNGMYMAAVNNRGNCYIWTLSNSSDQQLSVLEPKLKIAAHKRYALRCKFSPDSSLLVTTSGDGTARLWKTGDFSLWRELKADNSWVWDAAFSADSKYLFTASSDTMARLWKLDTRETEREYIGHQKAITALSFKDEIVS